MIKTPYIFMLLLLVYYILYTIFPSQLKSITLNVIRSNSIFTIQFRLNIH
jgi:hypothetical protein